MARNKSIRAKVLIGLASTGAAGAILFWALRKAHASDARAGEAEDASRAATATAATARAEALRYAAQANAAGSAAQQAVARANAVIAAANAAASEATALARQAAATTDAVRRAFLQRESDLKVAHAKVLNEQGQAARAAATRIIAQKVTDTRTFVPVMLPIEAKTRQLPDVLESKRQIVSDGFQQMLAEVERMNPSASKQKQINIAAAKMQAQGIDLNPPNANLAFWKLPETEIKAKITRSINLYITETPPAPRAVPGEPVPATSKRQPSVTTDMSAAKLKAVDVAYVEAVTYAMNEFKAKKNQTLTAPQALALILLPFRRASVLSPGAAAVPIPSALAEPDAFWANPSDIVQRAMNAAAAAAKREVDYLVSGTVDPATGKALPLSGWATFV